MNPTGDAHLILHHARHRELVGEVENARLARSVRRDRAPVGARLLPFLERLRQRRQTPIATPRVYP